MLHTFYLDACFITKLHNFVTWRTDSQSTPKRAESNSWRRCSCALGSPCHGTRPCCHHLASTVSWRISGWSMKYECCYSWSLKACVMEWVLFAATLRKTAWCEDVEERWKVCPTHPQLHSEDPDSNGKRCTGGSSLTSSSKSPLYSCAESQMRSIPHTPVPLLLTPGNCTGTISWALASIFTVTAQRMGFN